MDNGKEAKRRSKEGLAIGATALVLVIVVAAIAYNLLAPSSSRDGNLASDSAASSAQGQAVRAPSFVVTAAAGGQASLSQFQGAPVVLNFWASTCGPCRSEMPGFQAAFEEYGDTVHFMMVDIPGFNGETVERAKEMVRDNGYTFPVYFDAEGEAASAFGLSSLPRTYFIDADGMVVASAAGALSDQALREGIDLLL